MIPTSSPMRPPLGRGDARSVVLPNFLVVGGMRCGTTSLFHWLSGHPEVYIPPRKELSYFVHQSRQKIADWNSYLAHFDPGRGRRAVGDATPAYLARPESAEWIRLVLPDAKILILLRDPARRAFSHYCFCLMKRYDRTPTFDIAVARELGLHPDRLRGGSLRESHPNCYFHRGLYHDQVKRYLDHFPRERISIHLFEDLTERPLETWRRICGFLDISPSHAPEFHRFNESRPPAFLRLQERLAQLDSRSNPRPVRILSRGARYANASLGRLFRRLRPETEAVLRDVFRDDVRRLSALIDRDLSSWLEPRPGNAHVSP